MSGSSADRSPAVPPTLPAGRADDYDDYGDGIQPAYRVVLGFGVLRRRKTDDGVPCRRARLLFVAFTVAVVASTLVTTVDGVRLQPRGSAVSWTADDGDSGAGGRAKRQLPPIEVGNQLVDSIFQIPISTLNAVGSVIKNARPLVRFTRERIQQYYNNGGQQQPAVSQQQYGYNRPASQYGFNVPTYFGNNNSNNNNNNRKKQQQRDDPPPEGRIHRHGVSSDY